MSNEWWSRTEIILNLAFNNVLHTSIRHNSKDMAGNILHIYILLTDLASAQKPEMNWFD